MAYIVNDKCIKCKFLDCVEVCPVECFYEGESMVVINPDECIDCGVCVPVCPANAIESDTEDISLEWAELNRKYSNIWPNITQKREIDQDEAKSHLDEENKFNKYFNENPGQGD